MDKTFCIFGDSLTQAAYVKVSFVDLLKQYLEEKYPDDFVNVFGLGVGGDTTENILKRFEVEAAARIPSTILFEVGVNDTKAPNSAQFRTNLEKLIELAKKFTSDITFVGLVLGNWTGSDPFTPEKTKQFNQIIKEVAETNGCKFIQLYEKFTPEDFMEDGLHPNDQGHKKIFEELKKYF